MSITYHLPIDQWYRTNLSQWTLDYPPYFAYFEWILSQLAALFDHSIITLQTDVYFSANTLLFQRITVIICDMVYLIACFSIAKNYINQTQIKGKGFQNRLRIGLFSCFICNPV
jgi:alpha-1,3-glucosyltransferase